MATFADWLERKTLSESVMIDDNKLVSMLNEAYENHKDLINCLVETEVIEIEEKLKDKAPSVYEKVKKLGPKAMMAALIALGLYDVGVPGGLPGALHKYGVRPITKAMGQEVDIRGNKYADNDMIKAAQDKHRAMKMMDKAAKDDADQIMRYEKMGGLKPPFAR